MSEQPEKKRAYNGKRTKRQFSARVDEELYLAVIARAEGDGLRLNDAVEAGLSLWLQRKT
jgi:predicted HicB family RNase H-like nuclease